MPMKALLNRRQALSLAAAALVAPPALAASSTDGAAAARASLKRLFGRRLAGAHLTVSPGAERSWYAIAGKGGSLSISGDSPVALVRGAYAHLRQAGLAHVSWEGDRVVQAGAVPAGAGARVETPFRHRAYLNTCTYGYTTPWWGWGRWTREIDWMAAHGIDMPLAMEGQEYVWRALWREFGLSEAELADYFSGPAFTPWHRMGNIEGYKAPLPTAWIDKKKDLQVKILGRMRSLGMTPILPAFGGYVPKAFAAKNPKARIYRMRPWEGFHETYWLDPADPLFAKIAGRFLALYTETFGAGTYYLADSFNEMLPPINADGADARDAAYGDGTANTAVTKTKVEVDPALKAQRLAAYGKAIYDSIRQTRPDAVWVMQGWLFGADSHFWDPAAISAYLSLVPDDKLMILDIGNDRYPNVWKNAKAFGGKPWIYGYVHNYGGSNPVYGDLGFYRQDIPAIAANPDARKLAGFGMFPEGLHNNSIVYEAVYDLAWSEGQASLPAWLSRYARARYGKTSPALDAALGQLIEAAFSTRYWSPRWWKSKAGAYLFFKRPTATVGDFPQHPGDRAKLEAAVKALTALAPAYAKEPLFVLDLTDATRHLATMRIDDLLQVAVAAYRRGDVAAGDAARVEIEALALSIDKLLGVQPDTLATWIDEARAYGDTPADAQAYVTNAKAQVTIWGGEGNLNDYASKAWQGLYRGFYLPRWSRFLDALKAAGTGAFDEAAVTREGVAWERAWVEAEVAYRREKPADPIGEIKVLIAHLDRVGEKTP
ncbi:alpha-N-acetylglucosaminidase [Caulobacter sp. SL161]|uniref:alpha-N-acetylglucosaminidase n=1 Tax=Caulobacter sp. SL161 TaxID=2995156 RepID=UPI002272663C|nr:alpha-N-acetylglucosaminidase [Caulobacter sp. SL161]MCY1646591.1 alpha-N-acetylglucosaminidase [Caulobacter sp. SL161]